MMRKVMEDKRRQDLEDALNASGGTQYKVISKLGAGAYGVVYKAQRVEDGVMVAVKQMLNVFRGPVDAKRALREIALLIHFNEKVFPRNLSTNLQNNQPLFVALNFFCQVFL